MHADVLFAAVAVTDFPTAQRWYEDLFGRPPDVVAHDTEVMWQVTPAGWLSIVGDADRAGASVVTVAVADIEATTAELGARGIEVGPIAPEGDAGRKALAHDPDGNTITIIEVATA